MAVSASVEPAARSSSILSRRLPISRLGAALGDLAFDLRRDLFVGLLRARLDLADLQQHGAEPALDRRADLAGLEREGGVGDGRIDDVGLRHHADDRCRCPSGRAPWRDRRSSAPLAMRSRAAAASSAFGNTIWLQLAALGRAVARSCAARNRPWRRRRTPRSGLARSAGVSESSVILRYSGARNRTLRSSKYLLERLRRRRRNIAGLRRPERHDIRCCASRSGID